MDATKKYLVSPWGKTLVFGASCLVCWISARHPTLNAVAAAALYLIGFGLFTAAGHQMSVGLKAIEKTLIARREQEDS